MPRQKYIQAGDIFQANLSSGLRLTAADSWAIYCALQEINPSPLLAIGRRLGVS